MNAFKIFIFINLFCLFNLLEEAKQIEPYSSTYLANNSNYYLNLSQYNKEYELIFYQLESHENNNFSFTLLTSLSNSLDFSDLSETNYYKSMENSLYRLEYYYTLKINRYLKYFLVKFISSIRGEVYFRHSKYSPVTAIELYRSWVFRGYDFIYLSITFDSNKDFYFSFSFKKKIILI